MEYNVSLPYSIGEHLYKLEGYKIIEKVIYGIRIISRFGNARSNYDEEHKVIYFLDSGCNKEITAKELETNYFKSKADILKKVTEQL